MNCQTITRSLGDARRWSTGLAGCLALTLMAAASAGTAGATTQQNGSHARYLQVSVGRGPGTEDVCAVRVNGSLVCPYVSPAAAVPAGHDFIQVSVASDDDHAQMCALRQSGSLACLAGALGPVPTGRFTQVGIGPAFACAIRRNHKLACWGENGLLPTPPKGKFRQVSVGGGVDSEYPTSAYFACAVRWNHTVACWGEDRGGNKMIVPAARKRFIQVDADFDELCGLKVHHTIRCWSPWGSSNVPKRFGPAGYHYTEVSGGCGLRRNHLVYCSDAGSGPQRYKQISDGGHSVFCGVRLNGRLYPSFCVPK